MINKVFKVFSLDNMLLGIFMSVFIGIDVSFPIAHKILSYENYFMGIIGNTFLMITVSKFLVNKYTKLKGR